MTQSKQDNTGTDISSARRRLLYLMVFFSGFTGLIYQVLWMRQLGLLFGNTSYAAAATLAAFFTGLTVGSWYWGRRSAAFTRPLRTYAWLQIGIGVTALLYFLILHVFHGIYPTFYRSIDSDSLLLAIKGVLALALIFPPSFCMGGTIPTMGQYMIRRRGIFGATAARLYGINTIGAALGAFTSGFILVALFGFNLTCAVAMVITGSIAVAAFILSTGNAAEEDSSAAKIEVKPIRKSRKSKDKGGKKAGAPAKGAPHWLVYTLAFMSGFSVLALEVLWTRMFAQVHENSVYSFATVLIIVLICLAAGALIAARLARSKRPPLQILVLLTVASGVGVCISPFIFMKLTNRLEMLNPNIAFWLYVLRVFGTGFTSIGLPCLLLGTVFPFLMKAEEDFATHPGKSIGMLSAVNTVGAILGSLLCGFVLLGSIGMWRTLQLITAVYLLIGLLLPTAGSSVSRVTKGLACIFLILVFSVLSPAKLPITGFNPNRGPERILETWETSDCTVAVVENPFGHRAIKINSNYSLGSTNAILPQVFQARIPLYIYPQTESIFFLGLGTCITAGASLDKQNFPHIDTVVACELEPAVITAAKKYIAGGDGGPDFTNGLFEDPRVKFEITDGRHHLMATADSYDMINADLFLPYRRGAGSLYSVEHFRQARERLRPGGVFVQWLPMYQLTEFEVGVITKTMLTAFDQVTMWRNSFQPGAEVVALIGHADDKILPASDLDSTHDKRLAIAGLTYLDLQRMSLPVSAKTVLLFYCGNVTASRELFAEYPINTDDKPVIEYKSPLSLRRKKGDMPPQFVGPDLAALIDEIHSICPPSKDPMLANRTPKNKRLPLAGAAFHKAWIGRALGKPEAWQDNWDAFVKHWVPQDLDSPPQD